MQVCAGSERKYLARFVLDSQEVYIFSRWMKVGVEIAAIVGFAKIWRGGGSYQDLVCPHGMEPEAFHNLTEEALKVQGADYERFSYVLSEEVDSSRTLKWSIRMSSPKSKATSSSSTSSSSSSTQTQSDFGFGNITVQGSLKLERSKNPAYHLDKYFKAFYDSYTELAQESTATQSQQAKLTRQCEDALAQLETLVDEQKLQETQMYSRFMVLLNEKKTKIGDLNAQVSKLEKELALTQKKYSHAKRKIAQLLKAQTAPSTSGQQVRSAVTAAVSRAASEFDLDSHDDSERSRTDDEFEETQFDELDDDMMMRGGAQPTQKLPRLNTIAVLDALEPLESQESAVQEVRFRKRTRIIASPPRQHVRTPPHSPERRVYDGDRDRDRRGGRSTKDFDLVSSDDEDDNSKKGEESRNALSLISALK